MKPVLECVETACASARARATTETSCVSGARTAEQKSSAGA